MERVGTGDGRLALEGTKRDYRREIQSRDEDREERDDREYQRMMKEEGRKINGQVERGSRGRENAREREGRQ